MCAHSIVCVPLHLRMVTMRELSLARPLRRHLVEQVLCTTSAWLRKECRALGMDSLRCAALCGSKVSALGAELDDAKSQLSQQHEQVDQLQRRHAILSFFAVCTAENASLRWCRSCFARTAFRHGRFPARHPMPHDIPRGTVAFAQLRARAACDDDCTVFDAHAAGALPRPEPPRSSFCAGLMAECSPHTSERMAVWLTRWLKRPTRSPAALYCLSVCRCSAQLAVDLTELPPLWSLTPHSREGDSAPAYLKCHRGCIMRPRRTYRKKPPK